MNQSIVLIAVIAITCIISWKGFNDPIFLNKFKFNTRAIQQGQKYRVFTSGFLHADLMHLGFNMYTLFSFSSVLLYFLGDVKFLIVYIGSILAGSLLALEFNKNNPYYNALGASGGVTGVIYSAVLLYPQMELNLFFIPIGIPSYIFAVGFLAFSVFGMKKQLGNIGHDAHIGGALGGIIITLAMDPSLLQRNMTILLVMLIPVAVMIYLQKTGKLNK